MLEKTLHQSKNSAAQESTQQELTVVESCYYKGENDGIINTQCRLDDGKTILLSYGYGSNFGEVPYTAVSSMAGCPVRCKFCSVPPFHRTLSPDEIKREVNTLLKLAKENEINPPNDIFRISFTKEGDPAFHKDFKKVLENLRVSFPNATYKISTIFPDHKICKKNLDDIIDFQKQTKSDILLQISLHSTSIETRRDVAKIKLADFETIGQFGEKWFDATNKKTSLAFTVGDPDIPNIKPEEIKGVLPSKYFDIRIRGIIAGKESMLTEEGFKILEDRFKEDGYTFEDGRATKTEIENGTEVGVYKIPEIG